MSKNWFLNKEIFKNKLQYYLLKIAPKGFVITIELKNNCNLDEISQLLSADGETEINLVLKNQNKKAHYSLKNNRKFDLKQLKALKDKEYVEKITF